MQIRSLGGDARSWKKQGLCASMHEAIIGVKKLPVE